MAGSGSWGPSPPSQEQGSQGARGQPQPRAPPWAMVGPWAVGRVGGALGARTVRAGGALGAVTAPLLSTCAGRTKAKEDLEDKFLAVEVLPHIRKISGKCCNC